MYEVSSIIKTEDWPEGMPENGSDMGWEGAALLQATKWELNGYMVNYIAMETQSDGNENGEFILRSGRVYLGETITIRDYQMFVDGQLITLKVLYSAKKKQNIHKVRELKTLLPLWKSASETLMYEYHFSIRKVKEIKAQILAKQAGEWWMVSMQLARSNAALYHCNVKKNYDLLHVFQILAPNFYSYSLQ